MATAVLTGSISGGVLESDLKSDWQDAVLILSGATWVSGQDFNDARQSIIDGFDSAGTETFGWNAEVRDKISPVAVTRASSTQVRIALNGFSGFRIDSDETITVTVPNGAISDSSDITATPTFDVTADAVVGTQITNSDATVGVTNYEMCDRTNFRMYPGELKKEWTGYLVRPESFEERHPQEFVKSRGGDKEIGPQSPEQDDTFLTIAVTIDDL